MTAPSLTETTGRSPRLPVPTEVLATVRGYDDLVEAFRTVKERLGLSNRMCDTLAGLTEGGTDKVLGPSGTKNLSRMTMARFCTIFAVKLEMKIDLPQADRMTDRWEARTSYNVRNDSPRVSRKLLERAKPAVLKDLAAAGGKASGALRTGSYGSEIMTKRIKSRWRKHRRTMRERLRERRERKVIAEAVTCPR